MTVGQRVYWLAHGLLIDSYRYQQHLEQYLCFNEKLIRHLMEFMAGDSSNSDCSLSIQSLDVQSVEALIARGGILHRPLSQHTQAVRASAMLQGLIEQLGNDPSPEATGAAPRLEPLSPPLLHWQRRQAEILRNASFIYPSIERVRQTLANCRPAGASDLAALRTNVLGGAHGNLGTETHLFGDNPGTWTVTVSQRSPKAKTVVAICCFSS